MDENKTDVTEVTQTTEASENQADQNVSLTPETTTPSAPVKTQTGTIVRTVCLTLALINQLLVAAGYKALPISDDQVNTVISTCITIGVSLWTWWKNNSFTKAAIKADQTLRDIKNG